MDVWIAILDIMSPIEDYTLDMLRKIMIINY
jgi:hypothetical protein